MPLARKRPAVEDEAEPSGTETPHSATRRRQQSSEEPDSDGGAGGGNHEEFVKRTVRYALSCEYSRIPIRRDAMREKVFGKHKAPWKKVFTETQNQLRNRFGMELVELPLKEKHTLRERQAQKSTAQSSGAYVLSTTLPKAYRIPQILPPNAAPSPSTEGAYVALYTTIISLIYLNGGTLADGKLDRYLSRLNADVNMPMDKTEIVLQKMIKQGYIIKTKDRVGDEEVVEWLVGPRGRTEVGPSGVQGLVTTVYGDSAPEDLPQKLQKSLGITIQPKTEQEEPTEENEENE